MKQLLLLFSTLLLFSCSTTYYQVCKLSTDSSISKNQNVLMYENNDCQVYYNFWSNNGNVSFLIQNKTDSCIYINLDESFFILNGIAHDYFQNREFSNTTKTSNGSARIVINSTIYHDTFTADKTITYKENKVVCIPPKSLKQFSEFIISKDVIQNEESLKLSNKKNLQAIKFTEQSSPITFRNVITYTNSTNKKTTLDNKFFLSEIINYPEKMMLDKITPSTGKSALITPKNIMLKKIGAEYFYITFASKIQAK